MAPEGAVFSVRVTELTPYGVFVELPIGGVGLIHITELSRQRVECVEDVTSVGATLRAKVMSIDDKGRARLTAKT